MDARVPMASILSAFGVPATVTRPAPDNAPIAATAVWSSTAMLDAPMGLDFQRKERRRILAFSRAEVPTLPRGTAIAAPELAGGTVRTWRVDGTDHEDAEQIRVLVLLDE